MRIILDANIFISSLISESGPESKIILGCLEGRLELIYCQHLLDEIEDVIYRDKFRRWFSVDQGLDLLRLIQAVGVEVSDRPRFEWPKLCKDPDDNYLFALYEDSGSQLLISGDKKVQAVISPFFTVVSAFQAQPILEQESSWGSHLISGDRDRAWKTIECQGSASIFRAVGLIWDAIEGVKEGSFDTKVLAEVVVPGTAKNWIRDLDEICSVLRGRAFGSHPIVISPNLVAVKLVPDPGDVVVTVESTSALSDILFLVLERCEKVCDNNGRDPLKVDGWRAHSISPRPLTPKEIRPPQKINRWMPVNTGAFLKTVVKVSNAFRLGR